MDVTLWIREGGNLKVVCPECGRVIFVDITTLLREKGAVCWAERCSVGWIPYNLTNLPADPKVEGGSSFEIFSDERGYKGIDEEK